MVAERSPVTLLQVRRMSCQHEGSKIEIHPPLGVVSKRATCPGFHLSLYPASTALYLLGTCCSLCCCKTTFLPASVCLTLRVVYCVGEELACFHPPIQRASARHYRIQNLHSVKKSCFDTSCNMIGFNWRHQAPPFPQKQNNMEKFDQSCCKVEHRRVGGLRKEKKKQQRGLNHSFFDKGKQKLRL